MATSGCILAMALCLDASDRILAVALYFDHEPIKIAMNFNHGCAKIARISTIFHEKCRAGKSISIVPKRTTQTLINSTSCHFLDTIEISINFKLKKGLHMVSKYVLSFALCSFFCLTAMEQAKELTSSPPCVKAVLRPARLEDVQALSSLISLSVEKLQADTYTPAQRAGALGTVFGVDTQLINDGTYFVVECESQIIGCGGWSRWKKLFGSDHAAQVENGLLDPATEPARIRAFFVHPDWARRGVAKHLLSACEKAAATAGFMKLELAATLAGIPLYEACGFVASQRFQYPLHNGEYLDLVRMAKRITESGYVFNHSYTVFYLPAREVSMRS